jgi:hypothetical protein
MALDLSRLETYARELLEAEARRRLIRGPEYRTRGDLIRLILRHQYGDRVSAGRDQFARGVRGIAQARDFLSAALAALPGPIATVNRLRSHLPQQRKPAAPEPVPQTSAPFEREPHRDVPRPEPPSDEPGRAPRRPAAEAAPPAASAVAAQQLTPQVADDQLHCEGEPSSGLCLRWQVSDDGLRRARAVLGDVGELAIQLVDVRTDAHQIVRTEITEHGPVGMRDTWTAPPRPTGARCVAAVGLRQGTRFVAIAHVRAAVSAATGHGVDQHA